MYIRGVLRDLIRILAAGLLVAGLYATLGLGSSTGLSHAALASAQHPVSVNQAAETSSSSTTPTWSGPTSITLPSNAALNSGVGTPVEFCTSAGNCELLNTYGINGIQALYAQVETSGTWQNPTQLSLPANSIGNASLSVLTCISAGNCEAVGTYATLNTYLPFAITETNGIWGTGVELGFPVNSGPNNFQVPSNVMLSCASLGNCLVVITYSTPQESSDGITATEPFAITETNGTWGTAVELSPPLNALTSPQDSYLWGFTCSSAGNCEAVGTYQTNATLNTTEPFAITETNGTWGTGVELSLPTNASTSQYALYLSNLTCSSAGNCEAIGTYQTNATSNPTEPFAITETNGTWGTGVELSQPANSFVGFASLSGLTCTSAGNCEAIGNYQTNATTYEPFAITETNGTWGTAVELSPPANASSLSQSFAYLSNFTCSSAGNCEAVGNYQTNATSNPTEPFAITETNGTWGTGVELSLPTNASTYQYASLSGLTCTSAGNCEAIGNYQTNATSYLTEPFAITETNGTWGTGVELSLPTNGSTSFQSVSPSNLTCSSAGNCEAIFISTTETVSFSQPFAITETNGTWGTGVELTLPANAGSEFNYFNSSPPLSNLTCSSAGNCEVAYSYPNQFGYLESVIYNTLPTSTPPTITSITPASGLLSGGSTITITGTNLTGATAVDFGTTAATSFTVVSNTEITAVVPATSTPGLTDVTITTPEGTSIANAPTAGYLYVTASAYTPLTPYRICDTRANNPSNLSGLDLTQCEGKTLGPNSSLTIQAAGTNPSGATSGGVPTNASAVVLNVTVTNTTATSYLTAYPAGLSSPPIVSDLNWTQGDTVPNLVVVNVSSSGQVAFYNSLGSTDLIVDVLGYYG